MWCGYECVVQGFLKLDGQVHAVSGSFNQTLALGSMAAYHDGWCTASRYAETGACKSEYNAYYQNVQGGPRESEMAEDLRDGSTHCICHISMRGLHNASSPFQGIPTQPCPTAHNNHRHSFCNKHQRLKRQHSMHNHTQGLLTQGSAHFFSGCF